MTSDTQPSARSGWTRKLWQQIEGTFQAILAHPFISGLTAGTLEPAAFYYFLCQDHCYVSETPNAISLLSAKAPTAAARATLASHAAESHNIELALHRDLAAAIGKDAAGLSEAQASPTTRAYLSFVLSTVYRADFAAGLAAVLPCYWLYAEVGRHLGGIGSPNPVYQNWINAYANPLYHGDVIAALNLADEVGSDLPDASERSARAHFAMGARYEWMFWDAAWRGEVWPI
ncbi:MAG TPA: TenA family protein [Streptosporangiaceae bacterium]|nr:TenA family protein [Streptosporangiaceae bacterium]